MDNTVVVYSTKHGICERAAKQLADNMGCPYQDVSNIRSIDQFDNVVLGTSIYVGKGSKTMQSFIKAHKNELLKKNVALFIVCSYTDPELIEKQIEVTFPEDILHMAFYKGCLAAGVNMNKLGLVEKKIFMKVSGISESYFNFNCQEMTNLIQAYKKLNR